MSAWSPGAMALSRRDLLRMGGAAAATAPILDAFGKPLGGRGGNMVWRALGNNMQWAVQTLSGGSNWNLLNRVRCYSKVAFRRFRVVIPTFYSGFSAPLADTSFAHNYNWQVGFEYPYTAATSGLSARLPVTFGASQTASYVSGTGPTGYILSDIMDPGFTIPANTFFGLWTYCEDTNHASAQLPITRNWSNYFQRYMGGDIASTSRTGAAFSQTSIATISTDGLATNGSPVGLGPCFILIECDASVRSILGIGDSIMYGVGEGYLGSNLGTGGAADYGDCVGSALGNCAYEARWVTEGLGYNFVNMGRGSDGMKYASSGNWNLRNLLWTLANPTHVLCNFGVNDLSAGPTLAAMLAEYQTGYGLIQAACPGRPIIQTCATPVTTSSSDNWTTTGSQVLNPNWGDSTSLRGQWNDTYVRTFGSGLGNAGFVDPNPVFENGYVEGSPGTETSLWAVYGYPYGPTSDGTHPNSRSDAAVAASGMYASMGGVQVTDPFA